jgi:hypothetical protein
MVRNPNNSVEKELQIHVLQNAAPKEKVKSPYYFH